ncbi:MAG: tail protein X [Porticoccaceae bacterium]
MRSARARQGETLDALCHRILGVTAGVTEHTLRLNPGLASHGPILPEGTQVALPEATTAPHRIDTLQLWT